MLNLDSSPQMTLLNLPKDIHVYLTRFLTCFEIITLSKVNKLLYDRLDNCRSVQFDLYAQSYDLTSIELAVKFGLIKRIELSLLNYKAIELAISNGRIEMLNWIEQNCTIINDYIIDSSTSVRSAIESNQLSMVQWLIKRGATPTPRDYSYACQMGNYAIVELFESLDISHSEFVMDFALSGGNIQIVELLISKYKHVVYGLPLIYALKRGHVNLLRWLLDNRHIKLDQIVPLINIVFESNQCQILSWLHENKIRFWDDSLNCAVTKGNIQLANHLVSLGYRLDSSKNTLAQFISKPPSAELNWFWDYNFRLVIAEIIDQINYIRVSTLDWLATKQTKINPQIFMVSVIEGQSKLIQWFVQHNYTLDIDLLITYIKDGVS